MYKTGQSVVYVHPVNTLADIPGIARAQSYALNHALPMCVVTNINGSNNQRLDALKSLEDIENMLVKLNIPLIVLIGDQKRVLDGFFHHVKPVKIFTAEPKSNNKNESIKVHPHHWPGTVIPIEGIKELITSDKNIC
jgi:hypothetical protein